MPVVDDVNKFEAARRGGRRNAFGDLEQQFHQSRHRSYARQKSPFVSLANALITSTAMDQMMPDFQSMSLKP